ncbi:integrase, catalytic region, zinc finger, CCHC-type containing protein [Tanacetum coccineum]
MMGNLKLLCNYVEKYLGTVHFCNDQFAPILGHEDLVQGNIMINRVYYVEGLNHNLFSVGQFCDADLEVAFQKSTCFVRDLQGNNLLTGNRGSDLYIISLQETTSSTRSCFMAKASPTQAWLWHRRLSHLNFDYINLLSKKDIVIGLPKLKYVKDQLCSYCKVSKAKRSSFKTKVVPSSKGRLTIQDKEIVESSLRNIDNSNMHTFYQPRDSEYRWTKDHPPKQVCGNPSKPVQTRRQLAIDPEMCMFAITVSIAELKNIKEAMADFAWIEAMQEELHQFDRVQLWELVDKPFGKTIIRLKYGFIDPDHPEKVYRLRKALYGLKQAPRAWYNELSNFLMSKGFTKGLWYLKDSGFELTAFSDVDHAGCLDTLKSTSGGIQFLVDKLVSWMSKKHDYTAMSSAEAEYVALSASYAQVENSIIELYFVRTEYQLADMFTKALPEDRFKYLVRRIGMRCLTPAELEMNETKGIMPTKIELTLEQSQQSVSNDVLLEVFKLFTKNLSKSFAKKQWSMVNLGWPWFRASWEALGLNQYGVLSETVDERTTPAVVFPVPDLVRTMKEWLPTPTYLNGRGGTDRLVQFHGNTGVNDANKHLDKFLHVTQSIKVNGVTDDALRLYLFPHSLTQHATAWFDRLPRISITTFKQMAKMFLRKYFPPSMVTKLRNEITNFRQCPDESLFEAWEFDTIMLVCRWDFYVKRRPEECYDLIENMTAHHNDWDTSAQRSESSSSITSSSDLEIVALKAEMAEINKNLMKMLQSKQQGSFLKILRALIDVYDGELTLRVNNEAVTFNLDQTMRYSSKYDDISVNRIDVIDVACEEYSQEVLGFSVSGNPTPTLDLIISTSSPTLTPFGDSDFLLEETDAFLAIEDEPISPEIDDSYYDSEVDILLLEKFINNDPIIHHLFSLIRKFKVLWELIGTYTLHLVKMLKRCEDTNLCLNWEKSHFMVKEGIVLGHKISKNGIEVVD